MNLSTGAAVGMIVGALIGNNAIGNGISTATVSIGQLWMFAMMQRTIKTKQL